MGGISTQKAILSADSLQNLIDTLHEDGYRVIGPSVENGAVVYTEIDNLEDLPKGFVDEQAPGHYRLTEQPDGGYFSHVVGPHNWKRYLFPAAQKLWSAQRTKEGFAIEFEEPQEKLALLGVRACELHAMTIQDRVFLQGSMIDHGYQKRRNNSLIIAVNCSRAADSCFCSSMDCGPRVQDGYDLLLTELQENRHDFLIETGTEAGEMLLNQLPTDQATPADFDQADAIITSTEHSIHRHMPEGIADILTDHLDDDHWKQIEARCLNCGNCTLVCPTCFCNTVEDTTDLSGNQTERWRYWDSCFNADFSYIHGGNIRQSGASRYRQWMTHKLLHWHEQFGTSGCTGCGRCITWCPVGIDITEEAALFCTTAKRN